MLHITTDASHLANADLGGWAFVRGDGVSRSGAVRHLDSNRLELWAVLEALASLRRPSDVTLYTDSQYVVTKASNRKHLDDPLVRELFLWLDIHVVRVVKIRSEKPYTRAHHLAREAAFSTSVRTPKNAEERQIYPIVQSANGA